MPVTGSAGGVIRCTVDEVVQAVADAARGRQCTTVGIVGEPGAGKFTIAAELVIAGTAARATHRIRPG